MSLETRGLIRQSFNYPVWFITDAGRKALRRKRGQNGLDGTQQPGSASSSPFA